MESIRIDILNPKVLKLLKGLADLNLIRFKDENIIETDSLKHESLTIIKSINKGIEDAEKGNLKPHKEAREIYEKWL